MKVGVSIGKFLKVPKSAIKVSIYLTVILKTSPPISFCFATYDFSPP